MARLTFIIFTVFFCACGQEYKNPSDRQQDPLSKTMTDTANHDYILTARFNSFDTMVDVVFAETNGSITNIQKVNYDGFISKQDLLTPEILKRIFDFYKDSYADYKEGWTMSGDISAEELEKYLPAPTTPENLKPFITPLAVHIQSRKDCKEGTIGIEFDCTWDIKSGLGVLIKDWKVAEAGVAEVAYF